MNYLQNKKNILLMNKRSAITPVLTSDYFLKGVTTYTYCDGTSKASYMNPKTTHTTADNGILSFTIDNVEIAFPIDKPLYSSISDITASYCKNDKFCYKNGVWGIERCFNTISYNGTESDWIKSNSCTFAITNPVNIALPYSNSNYRWIESNITNDYHSYLAVYQYDYCIASGVENIAIRMDSNISTLESFKSVISGLYADNKPLTVIYELSEIVWEPLPDNIQKYLARFMI